MAIVTFDQLELRKAEKRERIQNYVIVGVLLSLLAGAIYLNIYIMQKEEAAEIARVKAYCNAPYASETYCHDKR